MNPYAEPYTDHRRRRRQASHQRHRRRPTRQLLSPTVIIKH